MLPHTIFAGVRTAHCAVFFIKNTFKVQLNFLSQLFASQDNSYSPLHINQSNGMAPVNFLSNARLANGYKSTCLYCTANLLRSSELEGGYGRTSNASSRKLAPHPSPLPQGARGSDRRMPRLHGRPQTKTAAQGLRFFIGSTCWL